MAQVHLETEDWAENLDPVGAQAMIDQQRFPADSRATPSGRTPFARQNLHVRFEQGQGLADEMISTSQVPHTETSQNHGTKRSSSDHTSGMFHQELGMNL